MRITTFTVLSALTAACLAQDWGAAAAADPEVGRLAQLGALMDVEGLISSAAQATGLERDAVAPAVRAFRRGFTTGEGSWEVRVEGGVVAWMRAKNEGRYVVRVSPLAQTPDDAQALGLADAVRTLPEQAQPRFEEWMATKKNELMTLAGAIVDDAGRPTTRVDRAARTALEELVRAQADWRSLHAAEDALKREKLPSLAQAFDLSRARALADVEALSARRIQDALGRELLDRYRGFLLSSPRAAEPAIDALLTRTLEVTQETRPSGDAEQRVAELREKRQAIEEALELATRDLVRERARKLQEEAERRRAEGEKANAKAKAKASARESNVAREADAQQAEIKQLRDELEVLRKEVEALRGKAPK